jgi:hypothetical protein
VIFSGSQARSKKEHKSAKKIAREKAKVPRVKEKSAK